MKTAAYIPNGFLYNRGSPFLPKNHTTEGTANGTERYFLRDCRSQPVQSPFEVRADECGAYDRRKRQQGTIPEVNSL